MSEAKRAARNDRIVKLLKRGASYRVVAEHVGVSYQTVANVAREAGIERKPRARLTLTQQRILEDVRLYGAREAGRRNGVTRSVVVTLALRATNAGTLRKWRADRRENREEQIVTEAKSWSHAWGSALERGRYLSDMAAKYGVSVGQIKSILNRNGIRFKAGRPRINGDLPGQMVMG